MDTVKVHTVVISALAFNQDWLYSSSWDGFVKVWLVLSLPHFFFILQRPKSWLNFYYFAKMFLLIYYLP
jgi:hypothetical protein